MRLLPLTIFSFILTANLSFAKVASPNLEGEYKGNQGNGRPCYLMIHEINLNDQNQKKISFVVSVNPPSETRVTYDNDFHVTSSYINSTLERDDFLVLENFGEDWIGVPTKNHHFYLWPDKDQSPLSYSYYMSRGYGRKILKFSCSNLVKL